MFDQPRRAKYIMAISLLIMLILFMGTGASFTEPTYSYASECANIGTHNLEDDKGNVDLTAGAGAIGITKGVPNSNYSGLCSIYNHSTNWGYFQPDTDMTFSNNDYSICLWYISPTDITGHQHPLIVQNTTGNQALYLHLKNNEGLWEMRHDGSGTTQYGLRASTSNWNLECVLYNSSNNNVELWQNMTKTEEHTDELNTPLGATSNVWFFSYSDGLASLKGNISYFSIWRNHTLTNDEMRTIWLGNFTPGGGESSKLSNITISHPTGGQSILNYSHYITFKVGANASNYNISIYVNGTLNQTLAAVANWTDYTFWLNLSEGDHNITLVRTDNISINNSVTFSVKWSDARFIYDIRINRNVCILAPECCYGTQKWLLRQEYAGGCTGAGTSPLYTFGNATETSSIAPNIVTSLPSTYPYYTVFGGVFLEVIYNPQALDVYNLTFEFNYTNESFPFNTETKVIGTTYSDYTPSASNHMDASIGNEFVYYLLPNMSLPLIQTNDTKIPIRAYYKLNQTDVQKSIEGNISVYFGMVPTHLTKDKNEMMEGSRLSTVGYTKNISANSITLTSRLFINDVEQNTSTAVQAAIDNYSTTASYFEPLLSNMNVSYNVTQQINMSYGGDSRLVNVSASDIIIYAQNVTRCSSGYSMVINVKDQATNTYLTNDTFSVLVIAGPAGYQRNFSFNYTSSTSLSNISLCTKPGNLSVTIDASALVDHINYYQGSLAVNDRAINSTTPSKYVLYLISTSTGVVTVLEALGNNDEPLEDYIVYAQRYFYSEGAYISIFSARTDSFGRVVPYLGWYDTYYTFIVSYPNGTVAKQFSPMIVTDDPIRLRVTGVDEGFANIYADIQHNCTWTNSTGILRCTVVDSSGVVASANLKVYQNVLFAYTELCDTTATGSAVTLTCNLSGVATSFTYTLSAVMTGFSPHILETGSVLDSLTLAYGNSGAFAGLLLTAGLALLGVSLAGGMGAIAFSVLGLIISAIIGIFPLGNDATVIVGLVLIVFIIMLVGRRD